MNTISIHSIARGAMHSDLCQVPCTPRNLSTAEHVTNLALMEIGKASALFMKGPVSIDLGNGYELVCEAKKQEGR